MNPCAVKGISILLALADAMPDVAFAAVPTWGTNAAGPRRAGARARTSGCSTPVDNIDDLLRRTRVLLVPSLWAEARSRIVLEAMLRGVPVMASNVGGIPEAKMGVPYLLPVNPIVKYESRLDEQMVPVAEVPPQDIGPWRDALAALVTDRAHYEEIARASRQAALDYAANLNAIPFERILERTLRQPKKRSRAGGPRPGVRPRRCRRRNGSCWRCGCGRRRAPAAWFPGAEDAAGRCACSASRTRAAAQRRSHAGPGGCRSGSRCVRCGCRGAKARLRRRRSSAWTRWWRRWARPSQPYLDRPFAFFGHSMGAVVAFELARWLRRRGQPLPAALFVSGARAPQFRRNHVPPPDPSDEQFVAELRRLEGIPAEVLDNADLMRVVMPALRADAALYRRYVYTEDVPLGCPIRAYGGAADPNVGREHLEGWAEQTSSSFAVRVFAGGHFYLQTATDEFLDVLSRDAEELC